MSLDSRTIKMNQTIRKIYPKEQQQDIILVEFNEEASKREREAVMKQVAKDVISVNELMRDLSIMVNDQGEQLDNIEININNARHHVKDGVKELSIAEQNQSCGFQTKLATLGISGVAGALLTLIILL